MQNMYVQVLYSVESSLTHQPIQLRLVSDLSFNAFSLLIISYITKITYRVCAAAVLAEEAKKIASTYSDVISVNILDAEQCKELKMGAYLAVAAAATENPPYFIHLCFKTPTKERKTKLALVGKGLTFDR